MISRVRTSSMNTQRKLSDFKHLFNKDVLATLHKVDAIHGGTTIYGFRSW